VLERRGGSLPERGAYFVQEEVWHYPCERGRWDRGVSRKKDSKKPGSHSAAKEKGKRAWERYEQSWEVIGAKFTEKRGRRITWRVFEEGKSQLDGGRKKFL